MADYHISSAWRCLPLIIAGAAIGLQQTPASAQLGACCTGASPARCVDSQTVAQCTDPIQTWTGATPCTSVTCDTPEPQTKIVELRADQANGTGPYTIPSNTSPWIDIAAGRDAAVINFAGDSSSGWAGAGTLADPYRLQCDSAVQTRVTIPGGSVPGLQANNTYTYGMWFRTSSNIASSQYLVEWAEFFSGPYPGMTMRINADDFQVYLGTAGWNFVADVQADTWYHVLVAKETGAVRVYVNGNLAQTFTNDNIGDQVSEIVIGASTFSGAGSYGNWFTGAIGQVTIFHGALNDAAALAEYLADVASYQATGACCDQLTGICTDNVLESACTGGFLAWTDSTLCANLVPLCAALPTGACCDGLDATCTDGVLEANCQGALYTWTDGASCPAGCAVAPATTKLVELRAELADGAGPYTPVPNASSPWVDVAGLDDGTLTGFNGTAASGWQGDGTVLDPYRLQYDGSNDVVVIPPQAVRGLQSNDTYTFASWFKTGSTLTGNQYLVEWFEQIGSVGINGCDGAVEGYPGLTLGVNNNGSSLDHLWIYTNGWEDIGFTVAPDTWYHIAVSKQPCQVDVYVNGQYVMSPIRDNIGNQFSNIALGAGTYCSLTTPNCGSWWRGSIGQAAIYFGALNATEVLAAYDADRALYLPLGACCDGATGICDDNDGDGVIPEDCQGLLDIWTDGDRCADVGYTCDVLPTGKCCDSVSGVCSDTFELECQRIGQTWTGGTDCATSPTCDRLPPTRIVDLRGDEANAGVPPTVPGTGTPWSDRTGNGHDGDLFLFAGDGTSGWQGSGVPGDPYRLRWDGTEDQRVTITEASVPELQNGVTHYSQSFWFRTGSDITSNQYITEWFDLRSGEGGTFAGMTVQVSGGNLNVYLGVSPFWGLVSPVTANTWYHLVVAKEPGSVECYLNGQPAYSGTIPNIGDQLYEIVIGNGNNGCDGPPCGNSNYNPVWLGEIAQTSLFHGKLTAAEAEAEFDLDKALYFPPIPVVHLVELRSDTADGAAPYAVPGAGSPWADLQAPANDATLVNFASPDATSGWQGTADAQSPQRLKFDGINDIATIPGSTISELESVQAASVGMWFKTGDSVAATQYLMEWVEAFSSPYAGMTFWISGGNLVMYLNPGVNVVSVQPNRWYHVVVAKDQLEVDVYVNGVLELSQAGSNLGDQVSEIVFGASTAGGAGVYGSYLTGSIGQVDIWQGRLDAAAALAEFQADEGLYRALGACCDTGGAICADDVEAFDCTGALDEWTANTTCAGLSPACGGAATGACCNGATGVCIDGIAEAFCTGGLYEWTEATACAALIPACSVAPTTKLLEWRAELADGAGPLTGTGSPWIDVTGNGHHGTLSNFAGNAFSGWQGTGTSTDPYHLRWDGAADQRVAVPAGSVLELQGGNQTYTFEAWVNTGSEINARRYVAEWFQYRGTVGGENGCDGAVESYPGVTLGTFNGQFEIWTNGFEPTGYAVSPNTWYHIVLTKSPCDSNFYVNGQFSYSPARDNIGDQVWEIIIGAGNNACTDPNGGTTCYNNEYEGGMGQVSIWHGALTPAEVLAEFDADKDMYVPTGACCDTSTGTCTDDEFFADCQGPLLVWTEATTCVAAGCAAAPTGACCDGFDGSCTDNEYEVLCTGGLATWTEATLCGDLAPPCERLPVPKVVDLRAYDADGAGGAYPVPGASSPWFDLADAHDGALVGFAGTATSGWQGDGTVLSPSRLQYDGSGDYVTIPGGSVPELQNNDTYSYATWINTGTDIASSQYLVEWFENHGTSPDGIRSFPGMTIGITGGQFQVYLGPWQLTGYFVAPNTWYHVVATKSPGSVNFYVDGLLVWGPFADDNIGNQIFEITIGAGNFPADPGISAYYEGGIAQAAIYAGELSPAEVLEVYEADKRLYVFESCTIDDDCVERDACETGVCDGLLGCVYTPLVCDDTNLCTVDTCDLVTGCVFTPVDCDDTDACTDDTCNLGTGGCEYATTDCGDGDLCTIDSCDTVTGCANTPIDVPTACDDTNLCTIDTCEAALGCVNTPVVCDDTDACTADSCVLATGNCLFDPIVCDDLDPCTVDSCDIVTGCVFAPFPCDDGLFCNGVETCVGGGCDPGTDPCPGQFCDEVLDLCTDTVMSCLLERDSVPADRDVSLEVFLQDVVDLRGYETKLSITRTSGTGTVTVTCPGGVTIDEVRADYIFLGQSTVIIDNCPDLRAASSLFSGGVTVGATPAYLSDYTLTVSPDADLGSTFEIAVLPSGDSGLSENVTGDPLPFVPGPPCVLTIGGCLSDNDCDDGVPCTIDTCNLTTNDCVATPDNAFCSNGAFCDGAEICDVVTGCGDGPDPCVDLAHCDEVADVCLECIDNADCDDGIVCTVDSCNLTTNACEFAPDHVFCSNTLFCDGEEVCNPATGCEDAADPCIDLAHCDEIGDACLACVLDGECDDTDFCNGAETCTNNVCVAGTPPAVDDGVACTIDSCDEVSDVIVNTPDDSACDNGDYCDGAETCDAVLDCVSGPLPCTSDPCLHCVEDDDSCGWCILDLNNTGFVDGLDFGFFSGCFGACYVGGEPCVAANFDQVPTNCVGTGDFAPFAGCFGLDCGSCDNCAGPTAPGTIAGIGSSWPASITVRLIAVAQPHESDLLNSVPLSSPRLTAGQDFYLEVWASSTAANGWTGEALASVYTDVRFDSTMLDVLEVLPSDSFGTFPSGEVFGRAGRVRAVGGCATLGEVRLGVESAWVRTAILRVISRTSGWTSVTLDSAGDVRGISRVGQFGNADLAEIEFQGVDLRLLKPVRDRVLNKADRR